jgi:hypothetical protein
MTSAQRGSLVLLLVTLNSEILATITHHLVFFAASSFVALIAGMLFIFAEFK